MTCRSDLVWNVYVSNFNSRKIEVYNVLGSALLFDLSKEISKSVRKLKDLNRELFAEEVRKLLMYYYWSKCEWEIVIDHWPPDPKLKALKVDVYDQVMLNWDRFIDYLWENRAVFLGRKKVGSTS